MSVGITSFINVQIRRVFLKTSLYIELADPLKSAEDFGDLKFPGFTKLFRRVILLNISDYTLRSRDGKIGEGLWRHTF